MTTEQRISKQIEYLSRIRNGERQLIPDLWELLHPLTARYIRRYIMYNTNERLYDESDLWQESYIALIAAIDYWQPDKGAFSTVYLWALQTATRAIRGMIGHDAIFIADSLDKPLDQTDNNSFTLTSLLTDATASRAFDNVEHAEYVRQARDIFAQIDSEQLTPEQRDVIYLRYYERLDTKQIAERLGISPAQCKSSERKAINIYRKPENRHYFALLMPNCPGIRRHIAT